MTFTPFAMIFPGQGSQSVGMMAELNQDDPLVKDTFDEASAVLGYDLWALVQSGPKEDLNKTIHTQPALLAASVATWRYWTKRSDDRPQVVAGHSLGEYSALVAAEALDYKVAVELVAERANQMQTAVAEGEGAMAAILGLDDDSVIQACQQAGADKVVAANFNAPGQVVISGAKGAVENAIQACKDSGAKRALLLPVSVPSHSPLMAPAAEAMSLKIAEAQIQTPKIPVVQNVDAVATNDAEKIQGKLVKQLTEPVRWVESVQHMVEAYDSQAIVECGPGKVLHSLNKRIVPAIKSFPLFDTASYESVNQLCSE